MSDSCFNITLAVLIGTVLIAFFATATVTTRIDRESFNERVRITEKPLECRAAR